MGCFPKKNYAEGINRPSINWFKGGLPVTASNRYVMTDGKLKINSIDVKDQGIYVCEAENAAGMKF